MHLKESSIDNEDPKAKILKLMSSKSLRVVKKTLVYIVGLHSDLASQKLIYSQEGLSKYGEIKKLVLNSDRQFYREQIDQNVFSAYVTFSEEASAAFAILALNNYEYKGLQMKANYGMTKYCSYFLKGAECLNVECLFLHKIAEPEDTYTKVD